MSEPQRSVQDDLAFIKALTEGGGKSQMLGGEAYLASGLIYGIQVLVYWIAAMGWIAISETANLWLSIGPTVLFLIVLVWSIVRTRGQTLGFVGRAFNAAFSAIGLANIAAVIVFAVVALRHKSFEIYLLYPAMVFIMQGSVWFIAWALRRRAWMGVVSAGWFVNGVALGLASDIKTWLALLGVGMFAWMVVPGYLMMRLARRAAA
jgi:hypothetical protein